MRYRWSILETAMIVSMLALAGCEQINAPQGPYLIAEPLGAVFSGHDSTTYDTYSNLIRIRLSDSSAFQLAVVAKEGDTNAFVYSLDNRDTTIHFLTFIPTQYVFAHPPSDSLAVLTLSVGVVGREIDIKRIDASLRVR